jgi:dipeptidyl aminopeptidase/acylaminoacyl peptidase
LVHGDKDKLVPIDHSEKIRAAFEKKHVPCKLVVIEGAGHGFRGDDAQRASAAMVAWFQEYLAGK